MLLVVVMAVLSWGTQCDGVFLAEIDITGLQGSVTIDTESKTLMANFSSACHHDVEVSIHEFPVIYGSVWDPCDADNIGHSLYNISLKNGLQSQFVVKTSLVACSLVVKTCDLKACTNLYESSGHFHAWRSTFRSFLVGHIYIMQEMNANSTTVISELAFLEGFPASPASLYFADSCQIQVNKSWVINEVGSRMKIVKSRKELPLISITRFAILEYEGKVTCTELISIRSKEASANFSMTGIIGSFIVREESPFHPSKLNIDLLNHRWLASHLTIHTFPVPARQTLEQDLCSHIGIGDLWNPLGINSNDPSYPSSPSNSHSRWEIGDLSGRHGPLQGLKEVKAVLIDYNLPLFGNNSIVGRSVVITSTNGSKRVCSTILQEEGMIMALASFRKTIVGRVMFRQPVADPFDDLSILIELSSVSGITSSGHNWHVHELPLQTEADSCTSAGSHFNPFNVPTGDSYNQECGSHNPFLCETGDYAGRHMAITFQANSTVRYFFTDTSSSLAGPTSIIGKSLVIHVANGGAMRMACANILHLQPVEGRTSSWVGPGKARGELRVLQSSDLEATHVTFNFSDLNRSAGGFHIHQLPVIEGSSNPCSNDLIKGHFNPFKINVSASPPEGQGSHDEYEVGDISGRQGSLVNKDQVTKRYEDTNLPLSGSHSILGRSLVIHYNNGSRMQCTTLLPRSAPDGEEIQARAVFTGNVTGSITLTQLVYPDGGRSDTMVLVDLQTLPTSVKDISLWWYIAGRDSETDVYNPYDMPNQVGVQTSCAPQNPLHCKVGDLTSKHGAISAGTRQLLTDPNLPLAGDFTVIGRALVVTTDSPALHSTTDLLPNVPVTSMLIPRETPFNKSAFREAISEALKTPSWKVTILPDMKGIDNTCLQVNFFVIGYNDSKSLASLQAQGLSGPLHNLTTCPPGSVPAGGAFIEAALPHAALYYLMVYLQLLYFS